MHRLCHLHVDNNNTLSIYISKDKSKLLSLDSYTNPHYQGHSHIKKCILRSIDVPPSLCYTLLQVQVVTACVTSKVILRQFTVQIS